MKKLFFASAVILLFGSASFCQTKGKVGLDFMVSNEFSIDFYDQQTTLIPTPTIGIRYNPIENLGIRGRLSYISKTTEDANYYSNPNTPSSTYNLTNKKIGLGIDAYYYVYKKENFYSYAGVGFTYNTIKQDYQSSSGTQNQSPQIDNVTTYQRQLRLFSGVQYSFNEHLSIFGEYGIEYLWGDHLTYTYSSRRIKLNNSKWNLANGGIGVTFSF